MYSSCGPRKTVIKFFRPWHLKMLPTPTLRRYSFMDSYIICLHLLYLLFGEFTPSTQSLITFLDSPSLNCSSSFSCSFRPSTSSTTYFPRPNQSILPVDFQRSRTALLPSSSSLLFGARIQLDWILCSVTLLSHPTSSCNFLLNILDFI